MCSLQLGVFASRLFVVQIFYIYIIFYVLIPEPTCQCRRRKFDSLDWEDALEKEMATHSSTLAWEIPWTEEPGGLQPTRMQRVRHDWAQHRRVTGPLSTNHCYISIPGVGLDNRGFGVQFCVLFFYPTTTPIFIYFYGRLPNYLFQT